MLECDSTREFTAASLCKGYLGQTWLQKGSEEMAQQEEHVLLLQSTWLGSQHPMIAHYRSRGPDSQPLLTSIGAKQAYGIHTCKTP